MGWPVFRPEKKKTARKGLMTLNQVRQTALQRT